MFKRKKTYIAFFKKSDSWEEKAVVMREKKSEELIESINNYEFVHNVQLTRIEKI